MQEQTTILTVEGMSCAHCVKAITQSVGALDGVENVMVTLDEKTVAVTYDAAKISVEQVRQEIEDQGFDCTT